MTTNYILSLYQKSEKVHIISEKVSSNGLNQSKAYLFLKNSIGSSVAFIAGAIAVGRNLPFRYLFIFPEKEESIYFFNDLENIFSKFQSKPKILFFPSSYKRTYLVGSATGESDYTNVQLRTEVLDKINSSKENLLIVTYAEALSEKVVSRKTLMQNTFSLHKGEKISMEFLSEFLYNYNFVNVDFVVEPGQFAIRGGIVDVFSFANEFPFRIEFLCDEVASIRTFNPTTQLSVKEVSTISILPDLSINTQNLEPTTDELNEEKESFLEFIGKDTIIWINDIRSVTDIIRQTSPAIDMAQDEFLQQIQKHTIIEFGSNPCKEAPPEIIIEFNISHQPIFNKSFELLTQNLLENKENLYINFIFSDNPEQIRRLQTILTEGRIQNSEASIQYPPALEGQAASSIFAEHTSEEENLFVPIEIAIHQGFVDHDLRIACYTDHQIFNRYHHFRLRQSFTKQEAFTLKDLQTLQPGDYVVHIDYGIGIFTGLEKMLVNGIWQETVRLLYKDNDVLNISIQSLHKIEKYTGKEGIKPQLSKLGSPAWNTLKNKAKKRVKDIAKDLIKLYAQRKMQKGFQFSSDTYLQHELESSFFFEDTPDQLVVTKDIKKDMESSAPMDRLLCGDVGFGKTELAIRSAFKAVYDNKQVAVIVPTTILALQHFRVFTERLSAVGGLCTIEYISRLKSKKQIKEILDKLKSGQIDIIIGTHRLLSDDVSFKDLGLLIIDEEQKFGVSAKEKLRKLQINVDTLTLTATPIPRTLQFSLMGARDISVIRTPPPNRYPIQTVLHVFNEKIIQSAIQYEVSRGGQVFFVNDRIQNIDELANIIMRLCLNVKVAIAHGKMESAKLEKVMIDFIERDYDVLVSTTIIESGLDIPNVNTIIINNAHNYGLSDLHQLRGRVGRSNKKAFCYLLTRPVETLSTEARRRLKTIEEFTELGSGFYIALRDLDIRGAGNLLGAEQSGFINQMGYETYHRIINEAISELREEGKYQMSETITQSPAEKQTYRPDDCHIETDLEILIPDDYVNSSVERLKLYKELATIENEEKLNEFAIHLIDRFGHIPPQTQELFNIIRLRWLGKKLSFEKILLKNNQLSCHFISDTDSPYFQSPQFMKILDFLKDNPKNCQLTLTKNKLSLIFDDIFDVKHAIDVLGKL